MKRAGLPGEDGRAERERDGIGSRVLSSSAAEPPLPGDRRSTVVDPRTCHAGRTQREGTFDLSRVSHSNRLSASFARSYRIAFSPKVTVVFTYCGIIRWHRSGAERSGAELYIPTPVISRFWRTCFFFFLPPPPSVLSFTVHLLGTRATAPPLFRSHIHATMRYR